MRRWFPGHLLNERMCKTNIKHYKFLRKQKYTSLCDITRAFLYITIVALKKGEIYNNQSKNRTRQGRVKENRKNQTRKTKRTELLTEVKHTLNHFRLDIRFVGRMQAVQTKIRRRLQRRLIKVNTVCLHELLCKTSYCIYARPAQRGPIR